MLSVLCQSFPNHLFIRSCWLSCWMCIRMICRVWWNTNWCIPPHFWLSKSVVGLRICIPNKFPGILMLWVWGHTLRTAALGDSSRRAPEHSIPWVFPCFELFFYSLYILGSHFLSLSFFKMLFHLSCFVCYFWEVWCQTNFLNHYVFCSFAWGSRNFCR